MISIEGVLLNKPYLKLIEHDLYDISGRIKKIEKDYFIVRNVLRGVFEVHSTANIGDTYCFTVPYDTLDARTLDYCRQTSNATNGNAYDAMKKHNTQIQQKNQKAFEACMKDVTNETRKDLSLAIDKDMLHEGYKRTVMI